MKFLIKTVVVLMVLVMVLGVAYSVLNPMLKDLGIELDKIFEQLDDTKSDETTSELTDTTAPAKCEHIIKVEENDYNDKEHKVVCSKEGCNWSDCKPHTYLETKDWLCQVDKHYKCCDSCNYRLEEDHKFVDGKCFYCFYQEPAHTEHTYTVYKSSTDTQHIFGCSVDGCTLTNSSKHEFGDWETVTEATCTKNGKKKRYCTTKGCDFEDSKVIPATGHSWKDGVCSSCNLVCVHIWGSPTGLGNFHDFDSLYHYEFVETKCITCSKVLESYEESLPHEFNVSGYCEDCGFYSKAADPEFRPCVNGHEEQYTVYEHYGNKHWGWCDHCDYELEETYCDFLNGVDCVCGNLVEDCQHFGSSLYDGCCPSCGYVDPNYSGGSTGSGGTTTCSHPNGFTMFEGDCHNWRYVCPDCLEPEGPYNSGDNDGDGYCDGCGIPVSQTPNEDDTLSDCSHNYRWDSETVGCITYSVCSNCGECLTSTENHTDSDSNGFCDSCGSGF